MRALALALAAAFLPALVASAGPSEHLSHVPSEAPRERFEAPEPGSYALPPIGQIATHRLLGVNGMSEPLLALDPGEIAVISFVYLSCGETCPLATAMLHRIDRELARDPALASRVELVTVSFDPQRDTPAKMRELRARLAPLGRWRFLTTPDQQSLRPVLADFAQDAVWIPGEANVPDALRHVLKVFLVDSDGAVRQIYSTGFLDIRLLMADLRTLSPAAR